jgi:N-acetylglucosamine-6-sulfatase
MQRLRFLFPLLLLLPLLALPGPTPAAVTRPNIVLIMTDDQHAASMSKMALTNQLLGGTGTTFTKSYVSNNLCCPSRATLLTGQYSHNNGVYSNSGPMGGYSRLDHANTLAVWLRGAGYTTFHVGKYLNGYGSVNPKEIPPGWTDWHTAVGNTGYQYYGYTLNENGVLQTYPQDDGTDTSYSTDVYTSKATDFILGRSADPAPFFVWLDIFAPHNDSVEPAGDTNADLSGPTPAHRHRGLFASEPLPQSPNFNEADVSDKPAYISSKPLLTPSNVDAVTAHYRRRLEALMAADEAVQKVVGALQAAGKLDSTVIMFTSDNGYFHGEHRIKSGKVFTYEEGAQVPLIISGPGIPHQVIGDRFVLNLDLAPTIVELTGATPGRTMDGMSLVPLMSDAAHTPWRSDFLMEAFDNKYSGVHTGRYVYGTYANGDRERYDLLNDPYELNSLKGNMPELARRLSVLKTCSGTTCR